MFYHCGDESLLTYNIYNYRDGKASHEEVKEKKTDRKYTYDGKIFYLFINKDVYTWLNTL